MKEGPRINRELASAAEWKGDGRLERKKQLSGFQIQIFVKRSCTRPQPPPNTSHIVAFTALRIYSGKSVKSLNFPCS